jgi:hypothetical protein
MREVLDAVDPKALRETFLSVFHEAQRGKLLERYSFFGGYLCLVDGSEIFNSEKIHCKNCCKKQHQDGRVTYHQKSDPDNVVKDRKVWGTNCKTRSLLQTTRRVSAR